MAQSDRSHTSSVVTMAVSCAVFEIKLDVGRKKANFSYALPFNLHDHPEPLGFFFIFIQNVRVTKLLGAAKYWPKVQASG